MIKITLDIDAEGWRPPPGFKDKDGDEVDDRIYNTKDFDRNIIVEDRRKLVSEKISEFLKGYDRFAKTIVFCVDIEHAEGMRSYLINSNVDLSTKNSKYVMQITGDNEEGKRELDSFISPSEPYPVIATTSKLMTTGVDAQTCKPIVLDSNIGSMTEFKQIIGRGTRINEDYNKTFFTIMDFRNVTNLFADPDFDGDPELIKDLTEHDDLSSIDEEVEDEENNEVDQSDNEDFDINDLVDAGEIENVRFKKQRVEGVEVKIINERVQYMGQDGKIITKKLLDYTRENIKKKFKSLDSFLNHWNDQEKKAAIILELENNGVFFEELRRLVGSEYDPFDLVCHVAYDAKPLSRKERAENVKKRNYFAKYGTKAQAVINSLLDKYAEDGLVTIESPEVLRLDPLNKLGTPLELINVFGEKGIYRYGKKY